MIQKSMIMPLISSVCLLVQAIFHKSISPDIQDAISTVVVNLFFIGFTVYGIFKNHKKPQDQAKG